jgi:hypothetical protein
MKSLNKLSSAELIFAIEIKFQYVNFNENLNPVMRETIKNITKYIKQQYR